MNSNSPYLFLWKVGAQMQIVKVKVQRASMISVIMGLVLLFIVLLVGCSNKKIQESQEPISTPVPISGDQFLATGYKLRGNVSWQDGTDKVVIFEAYLDSTGTGTGLMSLDDVVYEFLVIDDVIYVKLDDANFVGITDVTGHVLPASIDMTIVGDVTAVGFSTVNNAVVSFAYSTLDTKYEVAYEASDATFNSQEIYVVDSVALNDLSDYLLNYARWLEEVRRLEEEQLNSPSIYQDSEFGILIGEQIYSVGDICNSLNYYQGQTPEGMLPEYVWDKDQRIEILHLTYISSKGRTEFELIGNEVQSIYTTCPFEFLGLYSGMHVDELKPLLGVGLRRQDQATFEPIVEGLIVVSNTTSTFVLRYEDLTITLSCDKSKALSSITVSRYLAFREG